MAPEARRASNQSKRKQPRPDADSTPPTKQQTLQQHFNSSQHKVSSAQSPPIDLSPNSKRRKLDITTPLSQGRSTPIVSTTIENMYNFGTTSTNGKSIVDLSNCASSPPSRPRRASNVLRMDSSSQQTAPLGAKKLIVKNLRTTSSSDPSNYCTKTILQLDAALTAIFTGERPALSNEELYRGVENVCKLGKADELSRKLTQRCKEHVSVDLSKPLLARANNGCQDVLRAVTVAWTGWVKQLVRFFLRHSNNNPIEKRLINDADNHSIYILLS